MGHQKNKTFVAMPSNKTIEDAELILKRDDIPKTAFVPQPPEETIMTYMQLVLNPGRWTLMSRNDAETPDISDQGDSSPSRIQKSNSRTPKQRSILIKLYADAKDWWPVKQVEVPVRVGGHLDLEGVRQELGQDKKILVLNPQSFRPVFEYAPGYLFLLDIQDLLEDGFLRQRVGQFICWNDICSPLLFKYRNVLEGVDLALCCFLDIEAAVHDSSEESESDTDSDLGMFFDETDADIDESRPVYGWKNLDEWQDDEEGPDFLHSVAQAIESRHHSSLRNRADEDDDLDSFELILPSEDDNL
ncbi:hypothetical protein Hypma_016147 [Hypsizygus marmoreus]|uniref:Uncharacterized protein n=1 Tax=Hypsizygus marmoreus TaxID=39966 RepID=A0A369J2R3_HYPMA|nr:hypothetical protein Hypma_016147 [Hypsizygus marmoreus]